MNMMNEEKSVHDQKTQDKDPRITIEILEDEIRFKILMLLQMYGDLSLSELTEKIGKSKSTLHRHLQKLLEMDLVEESKEIQVRGNIPAKYYKIPGLLFEKLPNINMQSIAKMNEQEQRKFFTSKDTIEMLKTVAIFAKKSLDMFTEFLDGIDLSDPNNLKSLFINQEFSLNIALFTPQHRQKMIELANLQATGGSQEQIYKLSQELMESILTTKSGQEYFQCSVMVPLKKLYDKVKKSEPSEE